ncbi:hemerythrin domain-containing protein [Nucisporomicrobium flavum]|uniref:hemerythrin domain-containing protein n=1 Tax=Nucisporomicrobium flavum TaxID=2785915 RepID=UPI003C2FF90E
MDNFQKVISPDIVDVLRHEHEQIRQLCTDVRGSGRERKKRSLAALRQAVHRHQLGERAVAHPPVADSGPDGGDIARACHAEAEQIERSLSELGRLGTEHADFDAGFVALSAALLAHAAHQERDEFPLLRRYVPPQRLHMMASTMHDIQIMDRQR